VTALSFDGLDIREAAAASGSGIFFDLVSGYNEPASVRGVDSVIPGADGRVFRSRVRDARRIILKGYVTGTSASDFQANMAALFGVMNPVNDPADLIISDSYLGTGGSPTIACRFLNAVGDDPENGPKFQRWTIELESVVPEWS
jgi:hypothetical protein